MQIVLQIQRHNLKWQVNWYLGKQCIVLSCANNEKQLEKIRRSKLWVFLSSLLASCLGTWVLYPPIYALSILTVQQSLTLYKGCLVNCKVKQLSAVFIRGILTWSTVNTHTNHLEDRIICIIPGVFPAGCNCNKTKTERQTDRPTAASSCSVCSLRLPRRTNALSAGT